MKTGLVWALGLGLGVGIPALVLGRPVQAAAKETVQVQFALDSVGVAVHETNLGDLITDAVRQTGNAEIALVAADEVTETSIPVGSVAPARIVKTLRYADDTSDTIVVLKLTGSQVRNALERSVSRAPQSFDGFLQVSGLQIVYDTSQPEGKRVTSVKVAGSELQAGQTYRVAVTRPVADGSFGYFRLWSKAAIVEDTHTSIADALANYLAAHKTIHATLESRITP